MEEIFRVSQIVIKYCLHGHEIDARFIGIHFLHQAGIFVYFLLLLRFIFEDLVRAVRPPEESFLSGIFKINLTQFFEWVRSPHMHFGVD